MVPHWAKARQITTLIGGDTARRGVDRNPCSIWGSVDVLEELSIGEQMDGRPTIKEDPVGINEKVTLFELGLDSIAVFVYLAVFRRLLMEARLVTRSADVLISIWWSFLIIFVVHAAVFLRWCLARLKIMYAIGASS